MKILDKINCWFNGHEWREVTQRIEKSFFACINCGETRPIDEDCVHCMAMQLDTPKISDEEYEEVYS